MPQKQLTYQYPTWNHLISLHANIQYDTNTTPAVYLPVSNMTPKSNQTFISQYPIWLPSHQSILHASIQHDTNTTPAAYLPASNMTPKQPYQFTYQYPSMLWHDINASPSCKYLHEIFRIPYPNAASEIKEIVQNIFIIAPIVPLDSFGNNSTSMVESTMLTPFKINKNNNYKQYNACINQVKGLTNVMLNRNY